MNNNDIPVWEKYTLTIEEASKYFRIGENKLRRLDRKSTRLNSSHPPESRMPSSA